MSFSNIMDSNSYTGGSVGRHGDGLIEARERMLGPAYRLFYRKPVHLVRGEGSHLFDADGVRYLDAYNNVASVGHCHPHVVDAVMRQMTSINTHTRYLHDGIVDYSDRLLGTLGADIDQVMYACTGSEANDLALRVAAMHTGATGVIVTNEAYHGNTQAVTAISPSNGGPAVLGPHVRTVPPPDSRQPGPTAEVFADHVRRAADELQAAGFGVSCLVVDTIFSSDGVLAERDTLAPAVAAVRERGAVFIADEVQPGFGRTGEAMWGFDRHGVRPDIVTMGKPMGNGLPVSAMAVRSAVLERFATTQPYFNTFGGNPVSMAAAAAVLDVIESDELPAHALRIGARLREGIAGIATDHAAVDDIRGTGLYIGVEIVTDDGAPDRQRARAIVEAMRDAHVLISVCGEHGNVLKIRPPLVFSDSDVDWFCTALDSALAATLMTVG
ncbi:4-aminobutyrate aminotransferase [Gordonia namibiensis NBRC 108229]|uniref:4-aminobutyrate aminotransferase n=1 Tax=Gordonia namibiensis NBRC 108229 TaxID=1208314 RepID=K6X8T2_9ACTN|nr:aspartate aminotransferase family protein [Gordonia namibiensis]GAC02482.1 4-aminobutyrate aminotransferase [Gordonia namibiensis NBRC 108229]